MSAITTHVLDTARGRPAAGVAVVLERQVRATMGEQGAQGWERVGRAATDDDGRARTLLPPDARFEAGIYRLTFATGLYFKAQGLAAFYPEASVTFEVTDAAQHYHVPLLLSPFGYSTYRGS
jgi:5-hydroxyisourate hydrolase